MSIPRQTPPDLIELGRVVSAFGVQGGLKIKPYSDQPDVLLGADTWWLKPPGAAQSAHQPCQPYTVRSSREHSGFLLAQFDGVADRDAAHALKNHSVWVSRAAFPQADDQSWYWVDLIGCALMGEEGGQPALLGTVVEVSDNGAHALLHVRPEATSLTSPAKPAAKSATLLVPFVAAHVLDVDLTARRITTNWPRAF